MTLLRKRVVVAIGGNALIKDQEHLEIYDQLKTAQETAGHIADFIALGYELVLTHGNGPQVGFILRRSELAFESGELHFVPLINCVADTQGAIGYQLQESLYNALRRKGIRKTAATLVTMVEVDPADPAFTAPSKPIGVFLQRGTGSRAAREASRLDAGLSGRQRLPAGGAVPPAATGGRD